MSTLYEEVGGLETLRRVHKVFYDKVYAHPWLKQFFAGHDQVFIENRQTSFMSDKMGSQQQYLGKAIKQVHENLYITPELAELRHQLLRESLAEVGVQQALAERWLKIDQAFMQQVTKSSVESFYRDYSFTYKQRVIIPEPKDE